jgi:dolichol-phosphate mannosyltransferase
MVAGLGLNEAELSYERPDRPSGKTKFSLGRMLGFASVPLLDALLLRGVRMFGQLALVSLLALFLGLVYVGISLASGGTVSGWASNFILVLFFGSVNLLGLSTIGLLLKELRDVVHAKPRFVVVEVAE